MRKIVSICLSILMVLGLGAIVFASPALGGAEDYQAIVEEVNAKYGVEFEFIADEETLSSPELPSAEEFKNIVTDLAKEQSRIKAEYDDVEWIPIDENLPNDIAPADVADYQAIVEEVNAKYGIESEFIASEETLYSSELPSIEEFKNTITDLAKEQARIKAEYANVEWTPIEENPPITILAVKSKSQSQTIKQKAGTYTVSFKQKLTYDYETDDLTFIKATKIETGFGLLSDNSFVSNGSYYTISNGGKTMTTRDNGTLVLATNDGKAYYRSTDYDVCGAYTCK
ncbi:hypothetical protein SAMN05446037_10446 [Anaerovirgula multivorans]|uniref:Uncharacterized protein n=1 Tax=Anaerovirgula multivorans TaxID=312168 RepID=A0A239K723_9FIRM|nr:hypothetical protein [Anaerovirgula multivorans]SNT13915.1 hypothetical protein SAMN05446037_10446 [Anaerovirgula multivorans]